ncbi:glycosyltransferase-like domain-containing protein 1 isoform X2 [Ylistrum balloti]|nr:glycosyltransferase-like domain-containing protein 1 isoform X2 [Ylistrum balloti]
MDSFLSSINTVLKITPDYRPKGIPEKIRPKCQVLYFPLDLPSRAMFDQSSHPNQLKESLTSTEECSYKEMENSTCSSEEKQVICLYEKTVDCEINTKCDSPVHSIGERNLSDEMLCPPDAKRLKTGPLHIVWAHRWEHDKDPETFFNALFQLQETGLHFRVSVMGEQFTDNPEIFSVARERLSSHIVAWGYQEKKEDFYRILSDADVAVSTALHEFYGVSMLEAVYFGCYPLCPNRLVYPEIFPKTYLYNTPVQLLKRLKRMCTVPEEVRRHSVQVPIERYLWQNQADDFYALFKVKKQEEI